MPVGVRLGGAGIHGGPAVDLASSSEIAAGCRDSGRSRVVDPIDPAAIPAIGHAEPKPEYAIDNWAAHRETRFVVLRAAIDLADFGARVHLVFGQTGVGRDEPQCAALGARAEQSALGTLQYLDALEVKECGVGVHRAELQMSRLNRRVIDIDARGRRAAGGVDGADRDIGTLIVVVAARTHAVAEKSDAGTEPAQVVDAAQTLLIHLFLSEGLDAHRHVLESLLAPLRGDDDFLQGAAGYGRRRLLLSHTRCRAEHAGNSQRH